MFAHTIVDAPKNGAINRAAAISVPSVAIPTAKTSELERRRGSYSS